MYGKWYARVVTMGKTVTLEELAEHMAQHNTPYSEGVIRGVLTDMVNCIRELVLEGKSVKIPNLAIFSAGIKSTGDRQSRRLHARGLCVERLSQVTSHRKVHPAGGHQAGQRARAAQVHGTGERRAG